METEGGKDRRREERRDEDREEGEEERIGQDSREDRRGRRKGKGEEEGDETDRTRPFGVLSLLKILALGMGSTLRACLSYSLKVLPNLQMQSVSFRAELNF